MKNTKYFNIISNDIKETKQHPMEDKEDKLVFFNYLKEDLDIKDYQVFGKNNNFFKIWFNNQHYNIFIDHPDGGGRDRDRAKKIEIPFRRIKPYKKILEDYEKVLVINIYFPLNKNNEIDINNRVYFVVNPNAIYESESYTKKTWNPSSRWVQLEDILKVINTRQILINGAENVYIIPKEQLKPFFINSLTWNFITLWEKFLTRNENLDKTEIKTNEYNQLRKVFRSLLLLKNKTQKCEILNCNINILDILIASHIKPVNAILKEKISKNDKAKQIKDVNNGFLFCRNHDGLFDRFLITFDANGILSVSKSIQHQIKTLNLRNNRKSVEISNSQMNKYLLYHNKVFLEKEK
ncbi:HNH endonuclease [Mesomycoplasma ovipneumoniae]|uniref:HNH endonuclease signature motif containing protein n=1 Tax=Mesomycoplasma ovipneumoniae TaxID=29562 RepID=UPI0028AD92F3|nr:HNH endonuclease signature motif containing protein [Mesomycoplasma ovipneumoniae]MDW2933488.1 HNH endonuclease signature motif containing protein [Mesomycoplasma ovipneumoniae]WNM16038.1 HNH endonuclease signature motif containing protein [Mesomycoplasma ovipneumoniae]